MNIRCFVKSCYFRCKHENLKLANDVILSGNISFGKNNVLNNRVVFSNSSIGDFSYINYNSIVNVTSIGKFCSIGPNCVIGLGNHPTKDFVTTSSYLYSRGVFTDKTFYEEHLPVIIGNDVWIGANVTIINGVTIGDGAIIGANTVVNKNILPYSVNAGCPSKLLRKRFEDSEIDALLGLRWWNREEAWIKKYADSFNNVKRFLKWISDERI